MNAMDYKLSAKDKRILDREMKRYAADYFDNMMTDIIATVLYTLYLYSGWKKKKLKDFYDQFDKLNQELLDYYRMDGKDSAWLCKEKLKDLDINLDEWIEESKRKENESIQTTTN